MYRPSYNVRWTPALIVAAILALFPAALAQQKGDVGKSPGGKPDERVLQLIIEQANQADLDGESFDAVDEDTVIKTASKALENRKELLDETVCKLLFARGLAYLKKKGDAAAKKDADDICMARPKDAEARWLRAVALYGLGEYDQALADAGEAARLQPNSAKMRYFYGFMRLMRGVKADGDISVGLAAIGAAIEMDPKYPPPYYMKAFMLYSLYDPAECLKAVNQYFELAASENDRRVRKACYWKGNSLRLLNRQREAIPCLLVAHRLAPKDLATGEQLAMTYLEVGEFHLAAHYAEKLVRLAPDDPVGYDRAARAYAKMGRTKDAHAMLEKMIPWSRKNKRISASWQTFTSRSGHT